MSNDKKNIILSFLLGVVLTVLVLSATVLRDYFRQLESYREQNKRLAEQYQSIRSEFDAVRSSIKQSREYVEQSRSDVNVINDAVERIRKETQILQDYYDSTSHLSRD